MAHDHTQMFYHNNYPKKASHEAPFSLQTNESSQWLQAIEFGVALTLTLAWKLLRRDLT